jgi:hypothetical protein
MSKVTVIALLIAWILSNINCLIWRKRAKDAEQNLEHYRIVVKGLRAQYALLLNKMLELNKRKGADDE